MKNTFEAIYQKHEEIKARFQAAKAEKNAEAMEQARTEHQRLEESIELKGVTFAMMYDLYKSARERGNKHIDISAVANGDDRILAVYDHPDHPGWKLWIITEWDRSATTLLFPSEY